MKKATATRTFRRSDTKKIVHSGYEIEGEDNYIDELARHRLVRDVQALTGAPENKAHPTSAASAASSVSRAARPSPKKTAKPSGDGEAKAKPAKRKKAAE